jgi:hypothetical protein
VSEDGRFLRSTEAQRETFRRRGLTWPIEITLRFQDEDPTATAQERTYGFLTKPEADAFIAGIEAATGWHGVVILFDGRYPPSTHT